jgi:hypothetical protein
MIDGCKNKIIDMRQPNTQPRMIDGYKNKIANMWQPNTRPRMNDGHNNEIVHMWQPKTRPRRIPKSRRHNQGTQQSLAAQWEGTWEVDKCDFCKAPWTVEITKYTDEKVSVQLNFKYDEEFRIPNRVIAEIPSGGDRIVLGTFYINGKEVEPGTELLLKGKGYLKWNPYKKPDFGSLRA